MFLKLYAVAFLSVSGYKVSLKNPKSFKIEPNRHFTNKTFINKKTVEDQGGYLGCFSIDINVENTIVLYINY
jgi:hypothetical protein